MKLSNTRTVFAAAPADGLFPPLYTPQQWTRPVEWLALPEVLPTDNKVILLVAIPPLGYTHTVDFRSWAATGMTVDWGDGTSEAINGGGRNSHTYNFNDSNLSPQLTADGFKQAIITISAPGNQSFGTPFDVSYVLPDRSDYMLEVILSTSRASGFSVQYGNHPLLERVALNMPMFSGGFSILKAPRLRKIESNITGGYNSFSLSGCRLLEEIPPLNLIGCNYFTFENCHNLVEADITTSDLLTSLSNSFNGCHSLQRIKVSNTSKVTSFYNAFNGCMNLLEGPVLDTSSGTSFYAMFSRCGAMISVPEYNLSKATEVRLMFNACSSLKEIAGTLDLRAATKLDSLFADCFSLRQAPAILGPLASCDSAQNVFSGCSSLIETPELDLPVCTSLVNFAYNCFALKKIGKLITSAALTSVNRLAYSCYSLKEGPEITNTSAVTDFSGLFQNCSSLLKMSLFDTSAGTSFNSMFWACPLLLEVPALNVANATSSGSYSSMFTSTSMLQRIKATGFKYSFSVSSSLLDATALNELFGNLATVTAQTITISGNPGAAACDRSIATAKGWTVSG